MNAYNGIPRPDRTSAEGIARTNYYYSLPAEKRWLNSLSTVFGEPQAEVAVRILNAIAMNKLETEIFTQLR